LQALSCKLSENHANRHAAARRIFSHTFLARENTGKSARSNAKRVIGTHSRLPVLEKLIEDANAAFGGFWMHARPWDSKHTKVLYGVSIAFVVSHRNADIDRAKARRARD